MDQMLKARHMSSASARRKRIQEREGEQDLAVRRYEEHRRRILYDTVLTEEGDEAQDETEYSDESLETDAGQTERESSVKTPSEYSVLTPDDTPQTQTAFEKPVLVHSNRTTPTIHLVDTDDPIDVESSHSAPPSPMLKLQASLATFADFNYDRFSMIMAPPVQVEPTPDPDVDETESPIETARPVSFRLPKTRPSVISITSSRKRTASIQSRSSETEAPPPPPPRSLKRLSVISTRSGYPASEATLFEIPDLPRNATSIIANASRESLPLSSTASQKTKSVNKKASVPLLSAALKTSHARMSSIKTFIKPQSHIHTPSLSLSRPDSRQSRQTTSSCEVTDNVLEFETVPATINDPLPSNLRPRTATDPPMPGSVQSGFNFSNASVTALPVPPVQLIEGSVMAAMAQAKPLQRKKSFSSFRKRGQSIGQAIKVVANKPMQTAPTTQSEMPLPSLQLAVPRQKESMDLATFPTPPAPSPRPRKSVASFSPFPPSPRVGAPVGLGLRV